MNTTSLFVELIVIGVGTATWLLLLVFSFLDYSWILGQKLNELITLLPFLALVYVLGIITDHLAHHFYKRFLSKLDKKMRQRSFANYENFTADEEYISNMKAYVYAHAPENLIDRFEYDRSRLRIARSWSINFILLSISILIFVWARLQKVDISVKVTISIVSMIICSVGSVSTFYVWRDLTRWEYNQLRRIYPLLKSEHLNKALTNQ